MTRNDILQRIAQREELARRTQDLEPYKAPELIPVATHLAGYMQTTNDLKFLLKELEAAEDLA